MSIVLSSSGLRFGGGLVLETSCLRVEMTEVGFADAD